MMSPSALPNGSKWTLAIFIFLWSNKEFLLFMMYFDSRLTISSYLKTILVLSFSSHSVFNNRINSGLTVNFVSLFGVRVLNAFVVLVKDLDVS